MKKEQDIANLCNGFISIIDKNVITLWQGRGCNVQEILSGICSFSEMLIQLYSSQKKGEHMLYMEYVNEAMMHTDSAIQMRDDYKLADNLYYEWKEIAMVFEKNYNTCERMEKV